MIPRIPSAVYLWGSILVLAASNSIVRLLSDLGAKNSIDGRRFGLERARPSHGLRNGAPVLQRVVHNKRRTK